MLYTCEAHNSVISCCTYETYLCFRLLPTNEQALMWTSSTIFHETVIAQESTTVLIISILHLLLLLVKGRKKYSELRIVNLSLQLPGLIQINFKFFCNSSEKEECGFNLFHSVMENSCHFLNHSGRKLKPFATCLHSHVFPLSTFFFLSFYFEFQTSLCNIILGSVTTSLWFSQCQFKCTQRYNH